MRRASLDSKKFTLSPGQSGGRSPARGGPIRSSHGDWFTDLFRHKAWIAFLGAGSVCHFFGGLRNHTCWAKSLCSALFYKCQARLQELIHIIPLWLVPLVQP